jgi:Cu2+-containing amine oxidase
VSASGAVNWPPDAPVWSFRWEIIDGDSEAIVFRDVVFRGKKVLHKASVPMIRVHYDSGNGPYKDQLSSGNMVGPVKVYEHNQSGFRHLVVESYHRIGRYHLVDRWLFRTDGLILPQMLSAGLQHPSTHQHHVYWRLDFDIEGAANNLTLAHMNVGGNWGYGPGWMPLPQETWQVTVSATNWAVLNKATNRGYLINRGPNDEPNDAFEPGDMYVVAYHGTEDLKGRLGTAYEAQIFSHINNENIDGQDVVFWYVSHLHHHHPGPEFEWHAVGPLLWPLGY